MQLRESPPSRAMKKFLKVIEDAKSGKKGANERLYKYVESGVITPEQYKELIERHNTVRCINKDKKNRELSRKIKSELSAVILLLSMLCGLAYLIEQYGKGTAVWYLFLWIWAVSYAFKYNPDSNKITMLELKNELLKARIDFHGSNIGIQHKEDEIANLKKEIVRLENIRVSDNKLIELLKNELDKARNNLQ